MGTDSGTISGAVSRRGVPGRRGDSMSAGYSGTPLAKKLGYKSGALVAVIDAPTNYWELVAPLPEGVREAGARTSGLNLAHAFVTRAADLERLLPKLKARIAQDGAIWISWPKKAAKAPTDVTEDVVRARAIAHGLVDVKVCAV